MSSARGGTFERGAESPLTCDEDVPGRLARAAFIGPGLNGVGLTGFEPGTRAPASLKLDVLDPMSSVYRNLTSSLKRERMENSDDMDAPFLTSVRS